MLVVDCTANGGGSRGMMLEHYDETTGQWVLMDAAGVASPPQPPLRSAPQTATPLQLLSPPEAGSLPENSFDGDMALALHLADEERLSAAGSPLVRGGSPSSRAPSSPTSYSSSVALTDTTTATIVERSPKGGVFTRRRASRSSKKDGGSGSGDGSGKGGATAPITGELVAVNLTRLPDHRKTNFGITITQSAAAGVRILNIANNGHEVLEV